MTTPAPSPAPEPQLLPCPFCGDGEHLQTREEVHDGSHVFCRRCLAHGPCPDLQTQGDPSQAIAAWNTRTPATVAGMELARREVDSALYYLPQEFVVQHEDPYAAMALTFAKLGHAVRNAPDNAKLEAEVAEALSGNKEMGEALERLAKSLGVVGTAAEIADAACALQADNERLRKTLRYVATYGHKRPIERVRQVCQIALEGMDFSPLRKALEGGE